MHKQYADAVARYDQVLATASADTRALINKALALVLQGSWTRQKPATAPRRAAAEQHA